MAGVCCGCISQDRLQGKRRIWGGHNRYRCYMYKESRMKIFTGSRVLPCTQNNVFSESRSMVLAKVRSQAAMHKQFTLVSDYYFSLTNSKG